MPSSSRRWTARTGSITWRMRRRSATPSTTSCSGELVALETAHPDADHARIRRPRRVGGTPTGEVFTEVRHRRPMLSLSNAFSHDELRAFDTRVRRGLGLPAAPEPAPDLTLRRGTQDRRPRDHAALRARPVRPGRDPRRRHDRRGRDGQPAHDRGDPGPPRGGRHARCPRRGLHAEGRVRADQRRTRGGRARALRQPAQLGRGLAPPEGPGRHRGAGSCRVDRTSSSRTGRPR